MKAPATGILVGLWPDGLPSAEFYIQTARRIEDLGFDSMFLGDHIFFNVPNPETLVLLGAVAATTSRLRIGTAVLLLALRQPAVAAKQLATIDYLSGGRLTVGVGVGGEIADEWEALDVPLADRGARTDEYLAVLRALWSGEEVHHHGKFTTLEGVVGSPPTATRGGPPIWIGGRSDRAMRRAVEHQGWCAYALSPDAIAERVKRIRDLGTSSDFCVSAVVFTCAADTESAARLTANTVLSGMYKQPFEKYLDRFCAVGRDEHVRERIAEFRSAGVDEVILAPQVPFDEFDEQVERLGELSRSR